MEHCGPDPHIDADLCQCCLKWSHWVCGEYAAAEPVNSEDVHEQVDGGEQQWAPACLQTARTAFVVVLL
jgi:hypothetical protein